MAFDLGKFYKELDEHYAARNLEDTEKFLKRSRELAWERGAVIPVNEGCPSCVPPLEPNMAYVSVCNELACFYRGLSRFEESLEAFGQAQKELESLYRTRTPEYATVLLNKAGTYRYMGELDQALEHFAQAARILEQADSDGGSQAGVQPGVLAGLYNNIGLVWMDKGRPEQAAEYFERAMSLIGGNPEALAEEGTTWNNLAASYQALGRQEEAAAAIDQAVEILGSQDCGENPHYPAALNTRGVFAWNQGRFEDALADFETALKKTEAVYGKNVEYAAGCDNCAAVCRKLGREEQAEAYEAEGAAVRKRLFV